MQVESFFNGNNGDKVRSSVCGEIKMRALRWLIHNTEHFDWQMD